MPGGTPCFIFAGGLLAVSALLACRCRVQRNEESPTHRPQYLWTPFAVAAGVALAFGACGGFYSIYMFTVPIQAMRTLDVATVQAVELLPPQQLRAYEPLVRRRIVVTNRQSVQQIVEALITARAWAPNHPQSQWHCIMQVHQHGRVQSYFVSATVNDGTLVEVYSHVDQGWVMGVFQANSLRPILEGIAADAGE